MSRPFGLCAAVRHSPHHPCYGRVPATLAPAAAARHPQTLFAGYIIVDVTNVLRGSELARQCRGDLVECAVNVFANVKPEHPPMNVQQGLAIAERLRHLQHAKRDRRCILTGLVRDRQVGLGVRDDLDE